MSSCGRGPGKNPDRTLYLNCGRVKTLDPALAADLTSRDMVAACYDTLLQYDYLARPYRLIPSMLKNMPEPDKSKTVYTFTLRDDLYFCGDPCFKGLPESKRKVTSRDVVYSFLRIADGRLHSPVFWMFRGKIKGIDAFRRATLRLKPGDNSLYAAGISGLEIIDDAVFRIRLTRPDPRFLYALAIPYASVISRQAVKFYGESFAEHPVGSGPFRLQEWIRDFRLILDRNPDYRREYFPQAADPADRRRPLPLLDRVVGYIIKQEVSAWLLFLQGGLDFSAVGKDNFDQVTGPDGTLAPALAARGVRLLRIPEFEVRYVGFNFTDPVLADNPDLRRAISLAYNVGNLKLHYNGRLIPAQGPIPPGVAGCDPAFRNPYCTYDLDRAREHLRRAGYSGGIDPRTGRSLTLTYDQNGSSPAHRQLAELMIGDLAKIGIKVIPILNNKPRFFQKLRQGKFQLFRLSWVGDYPDAENFLQLFYSKNAGTCNRTFFRDAAFDRMFEEIIPLPDSPGRTRKYEEMVKYLSGQCPWIFESFAVSGQLDQPWLQNFRPHDFAFSRWKYLAVDAAKRAAVKKDFKPLTFSELRGR
ncbi:MAG: ABC transporter substrate-binding protein [Victivallaceae bacterium]|nr:ABC transporter substrate-binding protein [Victivallaceae bacterium]